MHYQRERWNGNVGGADMLHVRGSLADKVAPKYRKDGPLPTNRPELGPCWPWTAHITRDGYGIVGNGEGKLIGAHRAVYEVEVGPIPQGLELDHLCRNRSCVNPAHLEPVTRRENGLRGESIAARNARRTHCANGHEYTPENTKEFASRPGARICITCQRETSRRAQQRQRDRAKARALKGA